MDVRRATADDWAAIWPIFRAVVEPGDSYAYSPDITEDEARAAWLHAAGVDDDARARPVTFVAVQRGHVVGTALLKPNLPGLGDHVANAGWMVDPDLTGRGIGRAFAQAVIEAAVRLGYTAMQFNAVVATNERAITLWTSLDFTTIGTVPGGFRHHASGPVDLLIMHRDLKAQAGATASSVRWR